VLQRNVRELLPGQRLCQRPLLQWDLSGMLCERRLRAEQRALLRRDLLPCRERANLQ
jgi:hypothetical protein